VSLCEFIQSDEFMLLCEFIQSEEFTSLCEFIQSDKFTLLCEFIQLDEFISLCEFLQSDEFTPLYEFIQSDEFTSLYENSYIIGIHALLVQFPICGCDYFLYFWHSEGGRTVLFISELVLMRLEVHKEVLGLKLCLIGCNVSGNIQMAMLCTKHMAF
jgi:hypothetical protein